MNETNEELIYRDAFLDRTAQARRSKDWTQERMAAMLAVPLDRYRKYEQRSPLPHYLIPRFCALLGVEIEWLLTGGNAKPQIIMQKETPKRA